MKTTRRKAAIAVLAAVLSAQTGIAALPAVRASAAAVGDLNADGKFNSTDVRLLQSWLLTKSTALDNWQNADFDGNGTLNAIDLSLMKQSVPEEEADPVYIHLQGNSITTEGAGSNVTVSGKTATITASGVYYIDGSMDGGQVLVNVPDESVDTKTVKLFLNGVKMTNREAPCIMVENAENTSVNLVEGKENSLSDGSEAPAEEVEPAFAVLHAKDDLTVKGSGSLEITAGVQYGIHCNNDLKFNGGTVTVKTENGDAVRGRTSVTIKDGTLDINTEGDGVKATKGSMEITGGTVKIKSGKDALQTETDMSLTGGEVLACGDRGMTAAGKLTLDGCTLLATGSKSQCENLGTQPNTYAFSFAKEWSKNNPITLTSGGTITFDMNTLKKYRYAVVSAPALSGSAELYAGGIEQGQFSTGNHTDVNNADHPKLLYGGLFDKTKVHKIEVFSDNWDTFLANAESEEYYPCDVIIDGVRINNVGIRTKGNSSRMFTTQAKSKKYSLRIKFDKYEKYNNYYGLTELCMNNMFSDPSCMRDRLCYDALQEVDGVGPNSSWTNMYLNGQLYSFYFLAEQPGDTLAERLATTDDAVLYKASDNAGGGGGGMWGAGGNDGYCSFTENMQLSNFSVKFGQDDNYEHIQAIKTAINQLSSSNYKFIEDVIDVPSFLKGFAVNSVMCNYDSYNGTLAHNYYLMYTGGKAYFVGWDYNLAMGNFMDNGQSATSDVTTSLYQVEVKDRPLAKLLQVPEYYDMYLGYVKAITTLYANPETVVNNYADLIRTHVKADPNSFFQPDQFESNISKSPQGLQLNNGGGGGGGMWGGFGGGWGGGMWGGGGGFSFGGDKVSIVDFIIYRNDVIHRAIG